ncbi:hypothetical protein O181_041282 [Austropuccinia psidii MF-1]|uniref:Uncharacterized protein n=1 Tax=Austropuccinia psidii MF-1 TaxID=1389203 RepID=A0A9Q3HEP7_9BASI|nr:hypothetical protein [Austropuccinia psidii MF-1]
MLELPEKILLIILDPSESPSLFVIHHTRDVVERSSFPSFEWDCLVIDMPKGEDLILGFDLLNHFNKSIYWRQGLITFKSDNKEYHDPSNSFSNNFLLPNNVQLWLVILEHHHFDILSILLISIPIHHYHPLEMKSSKKFKML